ncbi:MAG: tetratricopeptide repeat protein [bacterium]|nr:tetratricopeptide repeat protein [bacterium]
MSSERLRYWERTDLVSRSADADGRSAFAFEDLLQVRSLLSLVEEGVSVRRIRRSLAALQARLPELESPLRALRLSSAGSGRVAVRHDDALMEPDGQLVIDFESSLATDSQPTPLEREAEKAAGALAWFERGCELDSEPKRLREAIDAYRHAITLDPGFADAHCNLGTVYFNRGDREEARRWYETALERDASHLEAHFNLANLCEEEGRRESAVHHYKAALQADPFFPDGNLNLALLYEKLELRRMAREHWRRYLQQVPDGNWSEIARERLEE